MTDGEPSTGPARELVPSAPGLILAIDGFATDDECSRLCALADTMVKPPTAADLTPKKNEAFLDRDSSSLIDPQLAALVWSRLSPLLPVVDGRLPVGLHGDGRRGSAGELKLYRYTRGQRFGLHVDQSWKGSEPGEETEFTFLLYLNSAGEVAGGGGGGRNGSEEQPLVGGDTVFMKNARVELARVQPRRGLGLLHAHGRRCLLHEGEEVRKGVKYVLRADVMYRRQLQATAGPGAAVGAPGPAGGPARGRGRGHAHDGGKHARRGKHAR